MLALGPVAGRPQFYFLLYAGHPWPMPATALVPLVFFPEPRLTAGDFAAFLLMAGWAGHPRAFVHLPKFGSAGPMHARKRHVNRKERALSPFSCALLHLSSITRTVDSPAKRSCKGNSSAALFSPSIPSKARIGATVLGASQYCKN
jgi:hypothetical protein